jgi:hypothetical protein
MNSFLWGEVLVESIVWVIIIIQCASHNSHGSCIYPCINSQGTLSEHPWDFFLFFFFSFLNFTPWEVKQRAVKRASPPWIHLGVQEKKQKKKKKKKSLMGVVKECLGYWCTDICSCHGYCVACHWVPLHPHTHPPTSFYEYSPSVSVMWIVSSFFGNMKGFLFSNY